MTDRSSSNCAGELKSILIVNPNAGSADAASELLKLVDQLHPCNFHLTKEPGEAGKLAADALTSNVDRIIVAGGDGTINEVINGIAPNFGHVQLGILPLGTGNDATRSLGIPTDLASAFQVLMRGQAEPLDLIAVSTGTKRRYFLNASAAGFSEAVNEKIDSQMKSRWGPLAYLLSAAAALPELSVYHLELQIDSHPFEIDAFNVVVSNGRYIAGGIPIAPQAMMNDGKLDLTIVPSASLADAALAVPEIMFGRHVESDRVITTQARKLSVHSKPAMSFNADGETTGEGEAHFEVLPRALRICVGEGAEGLIAS